MIMTSWISGHIWKDLYPPVGEYNVIDFSLNKMTGLLNTFDTISVIKPVVIKLFIPL